MNAARHAEDALDHFMRLIEDAGDEPLRMLALELHDQARSLHGRLSEASRIIAGFHGPRENFLTKEFADRVATLRQMRATQHIAERDYKNFADRTVA